MIYRILKFLVRIAFLCFYRKIYFLGVELIPPKRAIILVCNHPGGFIEPCLLACFLPMQLYFLARGDLFSIKTLKWLLVSTHQIPIFRFKDGFAGLRSNNDSIQACVEILRKQKCLLVFPEGGTQQTRRLRPLRKGVARIANAVLQQYPDQNISIVPVGFNLSNMNRFRAEVAIEIGKAIEADAYFNPSEKDSSHSIKKLTDRMYTDMKSLVLHAREENDLLADKIINFSWHQNVQQRIFPIFNTQPGYPFELIKKTGALTNSLTEKEKTLLSDEIDQFQELHRQYKFSSLQFMKRPSNFYTSVILLTLGAIPAIIGMILNILPFSLARFIADKFVDKLVFYMSISIASLVGIYSLIFSALIILSLLLKTFVFIFLILSIIVFGYFAILYYEKVLFIFDGMRWKRMNKDLKTQYREMYELITAKINRSQ